MRLPLVFTHGSLTQSWSATTLDIEDILSGANERQAHIFVADAIASFDTVDRGILGCASGRLGLPNRFFGGFILVTMLGSSFG